MTSRLRDLTYLIALMLMVGWLFRMGKSLLLPVMIAMIALYVLSSLTRHARRLPLLGQLPLFVQRMLVISVFTVLLLLFFTKLIDTFAAVVAAIPKYEDNLDLLITQAAQLVGVDDEPTWASVRSLTIDQVNIQAMITPVLFSLRGIGGTLFLVILYAAFFLAERDNWEQKLSLAIADADRRERTMALLTRVNERVGEYLSVKTVVNVILGTISYAIMKFLGVEFAFFWAVLIGLFNYIPYIGSWIGVIFPVLLSLAQFGSVPKTIGVALALSVAQLFVGYVLEPRMMSRAFNLSPFVVLFALAFWSTIWGISGAVLAVPLTASLIIVLAEIAVTRPVAIMLSNAGEV